MPHAINRTTIRERAASSVDALPRPFLRWAGSKRWLLPELAELLPASYGTYYEPFLGSGALFFLLAPTRARLSDACADLIDTFQAVRDSAPSVNRYLRKMNLCEEDYYRVRGDRSTGAFKRAAEFIYLNRGCFNGLYRVNASGNFNVPYGRPKTKNLVDPSLLRACAQALAPPHVQLRHADFAEAVASAKEGDLVYFDPPYVTGHNNNGFVDYNERLFSWADQERLARVAENLRVRGAKVIVSNANHEGVMTLFPRFARKMVSRSSTLASKNRFRRKVSEVILYSEL